MGPNSKSSRRSNGAPRRSVAGLPGVRTSERRPQPSDGPVVERMAAIVRGLRDVLALSRAAAEAVNEPEMLQTLAGQYVRTDYLATTGLTRYLAAQLGLEEDRIFRGQKVRVELETRDETGHPDRHGLDLHYAVPSTTGPGSRRLFSLELRNDQAYFLPGLPPTIEGGGHNLTFMTGITEALQEDVAALQAAATDPERNLLQ